jgi:DNA-binding Lrp family transcriptional regulator
MRLLDREKDFLTVAGLAADRSMVDLAKTLHTPIHQLHYVVNKLREARIIRKVWVIDTFRLGLTRYNVFFSLSAVQRKKREALVKMLTQSSRTVFLAEIGGDFDFELSLVARSPAEVRQFFEFLGEKFGELFYSKLISIRHAMAHFPRKYLSKRKSLCSQISIGNTVETHEVDEFDTAILQVMADQPDFSKREIAHHLGRPETSVDLRIKKLFEAKIIKGAIWSTNAKHYEAQTFKLLIHTRGLSPQRGDALKTFACNHPHITAYIEGFGHWDIECVAEVQDYSQLSALKEDIFASFGDSINDVKLINRFTVHKYRSFSSEM